MIGSYIVPWGFYQGMNVMRVQGAVSATELRKLYKTLNPLMPILLDAGPLSKKPITNDGIEEYAAFAKDLGEDDWKPQLIIEVAAECFYDEESREPGTTEAPFISERIINLLIGKYYAHVAVVACGHYFDSLFSPLGIKAQSCLVHDSCGGDMAELRERNEYCHYYAIAWGANEVDDVREFIRSPEGSGWQMCRADIDLNEITDADLKRAIRE